MRPIAAAAPLRSMRRLTFHHMVRNWVPAARSKGMGVYSGAVPLRGVNSGLAGSTSSCIVSTHCQRTALPSMPAMSRSTAISRSSPLYVGATWKPTSLNPRTVSMPVAL